MRTQNPISTISYNHLNFLKDTLDRLIKSQKLDFYAFIWHQGEDDEAGEKDHIHLYCEPNKILQTAELGKEFEEDVPDNPIPLKCITWKRSDFTNWYLYGIHDKDYLAMKNQSRKYHYQFSDMYTSDKDTLLYYFRSIDLTELSPYAEMRKAQQEGLTFQAFFNRGNIPIMQIMHYEKAWKLLLKNTNYRNGRKGHE